MCELRKLCVELSAGLIIVLSSPNIKILPKQRPQGTKAPKWLNISQLKTSNIKQSFMDTLTEWLQSLPSEHQDVEVTWAAFRDVVHVTALDILGPSTHKHKDWFDENGQEISSLLEE